MTNWIHRELASLTTQRDTIDDRIRQLRAQLSYPTVTPVLISHRYGSREERAVNDIPTAADEHPVQLLEKAYRQLEYEFEDGWASPDGVSVGGFLIDYETLRERFG